MTHSLINTLKNQWWLSFILLFSLAMFLGDVLADRLTMVDFEVYYTAAKRIFAGHDLYQIPEDGHYVYKYAPAAGLLFTPLAWMSFLPAKVIYWWIITFVMILTLRKCWAMSTADFSETTSKNMVIFWAVLTVLIHFHSELHLGQVNLLLMFIYVTSFYLIEKGRFKLAGILIGGSIFIKPFGLIFLLYWVMRQSWRPILWSIISIAAVFVLPIIFYPNFSEFLDLYTSWIRELGVELGNKQSLLIEGNHTVFSVLLRYTPLQYIVQGSLAEGIYQMIVLLVLAILFWWQRNKYENDFLDMCLMIIFIPLLAATTKNAFIFAMPLALYLIHRNDRKNRWKTALLFFGCFLIGGNIYELYGPVWSERYSMLSIYTLGAFILIGMALMSDVKKGPFHLRI